jgi:hypothetical protein
MNERREIILIGPIGAGKSTIGGLLAEKLGLPQISLDDFRFDYYREIGYDEDYARHLRADQGFPALVAYWKPFEAHAVERVLDDYRTCVFDFGAGYTVYEDQGLFNRVQTALAPFRNVVLLLPDPDVDTSQAMMESYDPVVARYRDINLHFLTHPSNGLLAKHVIYWRGLSPQETRDRVLAAVTLD